MNTRTEVLRSRVNWLTPCVTVADTIDPRWRQIETEADFYLNIAAPLGVLRLPHLAPDVAGLPWDVVTTPLIHELTVQPHSPRIAPSSPTSRRSS